MGRSESTTAHLLRALVIAGIPIALLFATRMQARSEEVSGTQWTPGNQVANPWPAGPSSGAQLDGLLEDQTTPRPPPGAERFSEQATLTPVPSAASADADERPRLNAYWDYGPVLESADKAFRIHIGGLLELDNTWYQQSDGLPFLLQDGSDMRRARLRADGSIGENVDFVTEFNFANIQDVTNESTTTNIGSVGLDDFYVAFKGVPILRRFASVISSSPSAWSIRRAPATSTTWNGPTVMTPSSNRSSSSPGSCSPIRSGTIRRRLDSRWPG